MTKRNLNAVKSAPLSNPTRKSARKSVLARKAGIRSALMLSTGALALFAAAPVLAQAPDVNALPGGGSFVGGSGTINTPMGNHLQIDQTSSRGVINWNNFDIGQNASVAFDQQAGNQSITVNRVIGSGAAPSQIFGDLTANGSVVIINGNGVVFGGTSNVNVGSLVATTSNVNDAAFLGGGALDFFGPASAVGDISVLSGARISVADAGLAAFVGPRVSNAGTITARGGRVVLAGGVGYTLDFAGDGLLEIAVGADSPLVTQAGQIFAERGLIQISAAAAAGLISDVINVSGTLSVNSAGLDDGVIVLSAGAGGGVNVSADLTVSGDIEIGARRIHGAGDVHVTDGELALNLNVGGANTTGETLIADALAVIGTVADGTTLTLGAGDYRGGAIIASNNVTLAGTDGARIVLPTLAAGQEMNGLTINADNVTIRDLSIVGPALNQSWLDYAWNAPASGGTTRGIAVWNGADNFAITGNAIQGLRTGIVIDGRNAGGSVTGNLIDNTKSAISVQYTDAGLLNAEGFAFDISGNDDGQYGNEWGANFHLNGHLVGATPVANSVKIANAATGAVQAALLGWSAANNGMSAQDQGYNFANRTHVNVAVGGGANAQGSLLGAIGTVQGGINAVVAGGTVNVGDGTYALNSWLLIDKSISLIGQSQAGTILDATGSNQVAIKVQADDVTLSNFTVRGGNEIGIKVEAAGPGGANARRNNFAISDVTINGTRRTGLDLNAVVGAVIDGVTVTGVTNGNGMAITDSANVTVRNSTTSGNAWGGLALYQTNGATGSNQQLTGIVVESNNSFGEAAGVYMQDTSTLHDIGALVIGGFDHIVHESTTSTVFQKTLAGAQAFALTKAAGSSIEGWTGTGGDNAFDVVSGLKIQNALRDVRADGTIRVGDGTYAENLTITQSGLNLVSVNGRDATTIQGIANGDTIHIASGADNTTIGGAGHGFTIIGTDNAAPGIERAAVYFAGSNSGSSILGNRITAGGEGGLVTEYGANVRNLTISSNILDGKTFVGAAPATGNQFTVPNVSRQLVAVNTGASGVVFSNNQVIGDSGLNSAVTIDSANTTITGNTFASTTGGWGSLFRARGADLAFSGNSFDISGLATTGSTLVLGTGTAVTNAAFEAYLAANGLVADGAYAETVTGSLRSLHRNVQAAINDSAAGGTVNVLAGVYGDAITVNKANLTLAGAGMNATTFTNGLAITGGQAAYLTLRDFAVSGVGGSATVVRNSGNLSGLTIDGVRIDGEGVAGRYGFIGGTIGGAISIANSEFIDIRGWAAFDTRSGGGGGADVTSVNFSNNLLDGTVGHIAFRQNAPVDVLISGNTVRNVGDTTDLSSGIFKVFGAYKVDFIGNTVTGVGASPTKFTAGVADGAALIVNNTEVLNLTNNVFTDNQQAFLVGAGNALPTTTILKGNTFTNNAYDIFLPASTGGEITFGAGNNFNSGVDTVAHLVWVGASAVDMTGVKFNGKLGSAMSTADLFILEDRIYHGVDALGAGLVTVKTGHLFATPTAGNLNRAVNLAVNGDTVNIANGAHNLGSTRLIVDQSITLAGQSQAGTIIDGRGVGGGLGTLLVSADNVSLSNFTLYGADSGVNNFGIKVQPNPSNYSAGQRLYDFSINDVTVRGSTRAELDLNGVVGARITNFTANGYKVGTTTSTGGAGIQITDSQDIYLSGITTLGNDWGSVAIYQSNRAGAYDALTDNINIDGTNSSFSEFLGVFVESNSTLHPQIGELHLSGFDHTVRSPGHRADGQNFTFFRTTLDDAIDFAANLDAGSASSTSTVQGFDGSNGTRHYYVGTGDLLTGGARNLSIQAAFNGSGEDATVHVASGDYAEALTLTGRRTLQFGEVGVNGLSLTTGALGSTMAGHLTAGAGGLIFATGISLGDDLSLTARNGGAINLAGVYGAHGLTVSGEAVTLGAVGPGGHALASLDVHGATIVTNGVTTTGAQSYAGALTLNGAYSASNMTALGAVTLAGDTSVDAGDVALGAVNGAHALSVDADRSVSLGRVGATQALASLDVDGATIVTSGATTMGAQSYAGALTLNGAYSASDVTALGAITLAGDTSVNAGDVALGSVNGAHALSVDADRSVRLGRVGATQALTSLDVDGATIVTDGATTAGAQTYAGALTLNGAYSASDVTALGAVTLAGDTSVNAGDVALGSVNGAHALSVDADRSVSLGRVGATQALTSLDVDGATIVTSGATTTGAQSYAGTLTLNGAYSASDVTALGAVILAGDTSVNAGDVALGAVNGAHALTVDADRSVRLGRVGATQALASLDVEGASIVTSGATTTGTQLYRGGTGFAGDYLAGNGDFTVQGAATLLGDTSVSTGNGAIGLGSVDGVSAGGQSLNLNAGNNNATVGSFGSNVRLGAVTVNAGQTVLQGNTYAGNSLAFTGGAGSTVRLTRVSTTFNTAQSNGAGGDIAIRPHLIGTTAGAQSVVLIAGDGLSKAGGDITLGNAGTEALRLGSMTATGDNASAATVKLAGNYTSLLAGNQVFTAQTLDTLGNVVMRVAGDETGSIVALGSVFIQTGGSSSGVLNAGGPVTINAGTGVDRIITSGGDVSLSSLTGEIGGSITSGGAVSINGGDHVSTTIVAGSGVGITTGGGISSNITTPGQIALDAGQNINITVDAGTVVVNAPGGTVNGVFNGIATPGNATLIVNGQAVIGDGNAAIRQILTDNFLVSVGGIVGSNGQIQLPVGLAISLIAPAGEGEGQRRPIIVNNIERLGELLRLGYTAIVVQIDEEPAFEQELNLAEGEVTTPAA